jgi:N-acetylglucosamine-6-phosphate deacetylase
MTGVYDALGPQGFGAYEVDWESGSWTRVSRPPQGLLIPGFVDIHIHGAFGIDFMSATSEEMVLLCQKLQAQGYETFLPTTVTASSEAILAAIGNLPSDPMITGFHLEGPFISSDYPGAQPPSAIALPPIGATEWDEVLDHPRLKLVTLAPEIPNALELIARLSNRGVLVSMGHTNATYDEARRGFEFGANHATHMFNAMRPFHHREASVVGYALTNDAVYTELIYDRLHVSPQSVKLLLKSKPADKVVAVSDSTLATGMPPNLKVEMWGLQVVTAKGEVRLADSGALAGSAITLLDAFRNLYEDFGAETAIRTCCINPRLSMGWSTTPRVFVEMDKDLQIIGRRVAA